MPLSPGLETARGFAPEAAPPPAPKPARETPTEPTAPPAPPTSPQHYLVPRSHWPDMACTEHDGRGWEVAITERRPPWAKVEYVSACDDQGVKYESNWRRIKDLIPIEQPEAPPPEPRLG